MDTKEIERLLLENLKMNREIREYVIKIDRRQRITRALNTFYWIVIIGLAVGGYYFAFPYLQEFRETLQGTWNDVSSAVMMPPLGNGPKQ